jgi:dTDP-4-amino-4,6-dideoxygalactose transaminase
VVQSANWNKCTGDLPSQLAVRTSPRGTQSDAHETPADQRRAIAESFATTVLEYFTTLSASSGPLNRDRSSGTANRPVRVDTTRRQHRQTVGSLGTIISMTERTLGPPIPFNRPSIEGDELELMLAAVDDGHISAGGVFSRRVVELLQEELGAADVLLTTSCTDALEMAALLLDLGPDDIVVVPSFSFVSTALAFARTGARLRFADIEAQTLGLDPQSVAAVLDDRVRAIVPVHYAGVGCEIDGLQDVLSGSAAEIVEDNAHGLYGRYRQKPLGTFGRFSTLSFHETKNFICGEGGALVLNEARDVDRAHTILDKGTNRRSFLLGQVDKYSWVDTGSSFGLSDLLAAFLLGQLLAKKEVLNKRRNVAEHYKRLLAPLEAELDFKCMTVPDDRDQAYHMFYLLLRSQRTRNRVLASLNEEGILATFHYLSLHSSPAAARFSDSPADCPVTDDISGRLLRLPFYNSLQPQEIERIVDRFASAASQAIAREDD